MKDRTGGLEHHCRTFPIMSYSPRRSGRLVATECRRPSLLPASLCEPDFARQSPTSCRPTGGGRAILYKGVRLRRTGLGFAPGIRRHRPCYTGSGLFAGTGLQIHNPIASGPSNCADQNYSADAIRQMGVAFSGQADPSVLFRRADPASTPIRK